MARWMVLVALESGFAGTPRRGFGVPQPRPPWKPQPPCEIGIFRSRSSANSSYKTNAKRKSFAGLATLSSAFTGWQQLRQAGLADKPTRRPAGSKILTIRPPYVNLRLRGLLFYDTGSWTTAY